MSTTARELAVNRRFCSVEDIDLIQETIGEFKPDLTVILGAGSGTMSLAWLEVRTPEMVLVSVDNDRDALMWEGRQWEASGYGGQMEGVHQWFANSPDAPGYLIDRSIVDFLIVDADHTQAGVLRDIDAWLPLLNPGAVLMLHDYDATDAPNHWPGVKTAADAMLWPERWQKLIRKGWSQTWLRLS